MSCAALRTISRLELSLMARLTMAAMNTAPHVELRKEPSSVCARTLDLVGIVTPGRSV